MVSAMAKGAACVPFFVMPALLTVDAPDIHGGHTIHLQETLALAALGATGALALLLGEPGMLSADARRRVRRIGIVLGFLALFYGAARLGVRAADRVSALLGVHPPGVVGWGDAHGPGLISLTLLAATAVRTGLRFAVPSRPVRVATLVLAGIVVTRLAALAGAPPIAAQIPLWLLLAGVAVREPWSSPEARATPEPRWVVRSAALLGLAAVAPPKGLAWILGIGVLGGAEWAGVPRRVSEAARGLRERAPDEIKTVGFAAAALILVPATVIALQLLPALGAALASGIGTTQPEAYRGLPPLAQAAIVLFVLVAMAQLVRGRPIAGTVSWVVAGGVAATTVGTLGGRGPGDLAAFFAACGAVAGILGLVRGRGGNDRVGPLVLGAMMGAGLLRIAWAAAVPISAPVPVILAMGAVLGAGVGHRTTRGGSAPRPPAAYAADLAVGACSVFLPMFGAVAYGVHRSGVLVVLGVAVLVLATTRVRARWVVFATFYATFAIVTHFKAGPTESRCEAVIAEGGATLIFPRFGPDPDARVMEPYDVLPIPGTSHLLVSLKRYQGEGGHLALIDADTGTLLDRIRPHDERSGTALPAWPERLEWDPRRGTAWVQVLAEDGYALWEIVPTAAGIDVGRTLPLGWEPGNPAIDLARDRLVVTYVPNRETVNPLIEAFALDGLESAVVGGDTRTRGLFDMADYAAVDPSSGLYFVPAFFDLVRFALVEFQGDDGTVRRRRETFHPTIGIAAHGERGRIYLTNATAGTLEVLATSDLLLRSRLPAGALPRDLVFDRKRERLYVAGYGDGLVTTYDVSGHTVERLGTVSVGSLLRGLGLDPVSGRVFGASGCGIFEIPRM
jgi:hypothetical protein